MAKWIYKGLGAGNKVVEGEIEANSKEDAIALLRRKKVGNPQVRKKAVEIKLNFGSGIGSKDLSRFTRQFSAMNGSGLPLVQCLTILEDQSDNPAMKDVVHKIAQTITGGGSLADALGMHPKVFDKLYVHMVAAGEAGGILDQILARLAEYQENAERLKRKVKGAMTYPAIVMLVAIAVVTVLLTLVVPKFAEIFKQGGGQLPLPTAIVMNISDFLKGNFLILFLGVVMIVVGFKQMLRVPAGLRAWHMFLLKAPAIGDLETKSGVARFSRTLGTLLKSGVGIMDALNVTAKTAGNVVLEEAIVHTAEAIAGGKSIVDPLKETGIFPPMVTQMIGVGERTGQLPDMLIRISDFYDEEVDAAVDAITSLIEPLIIVFLGVVIGAILIAMYMPMFSLTDNVS